METDSLFNVKNCLPLKRNFSQVIPLHPTLKHFVLRSILIYLNLPSGIMLSL